MGKKWPPNKDWPKLWKSAGSNTITLRKRGFNPFNEPYRKTGGLEAAILKSMVQNEKRLQREAAETRNRMEGVETKGWAKSGDTYHSVEEVCLELPPGMYSMDIADGKRLFTRIQSPSDTPINLPGLPTEYILEQIKKFWSRADEYAKYGFLHKRGILLHGSPGNGKTSIINLLCAELIKLGGIIFTVDGFRTAAQCISHFRSVEPDRPIMTLMEDVDGSFGGDEGYAQIKAALSFLDGQDQVNNIVHVATTNHPELIADKFIKRPGRFDLIMGIHAPKAETREAYLRHVTSNQVPEDKLQELIRKTDGLSLAYLRELASTYLCLEIPVDETLARLKMNFNSKVKSKGKPQMGFTLGYEEEEE